MSEEQAPGPDPPEPVRRVKTHVTPEDKIAEALTLSRGLIGPAAQALGLTRRAVYYRIKESQRLAEIVHDARESQLDLTEGALFQAISRGEAWAICFYLKCVGKQRGYVEQAKVDHTGQVDVVHHDANKVYRGVLEQLDDDPRWLNYARTSESEALGSHVARVPVGPGDEGDAGQYQPVEAGGSLDVRGGSDPLHDPEPGDDGEDPTF